MSDRTIKVNELLKQHLGMIIAKEVELPQGTIVTIANVDVSPDLKYAKVFISILPFEQSIAVLKILAREAKNLEQILNQEITLRVIPKLRFFIDETEQQASELDRLLDNLQ